MRPTTRVHPADCLHQPEWPSRDGRSIGVLGRSQHALFVRHEEFIPAHHEPAQGGSSTASSRSVF
jgi:hypothetical protein